MTLHKEGTCAEFYENNNILGYFCIDPKDYSNYMFLIGDSENRDNNYSRLRNGVLQFSLKLTVISIFFIEFNRLTI